MDVLWDSDRDLTINEISERSNDPRLNAPCISQVMPRLLKKGLVHVEKFIPVNTKYARTFVANVTRQDYLEGRLQHLLKNSGIRSALSALVSFGGADETDSLIQEMEAFIQDYKRKKKG